MALATLAGLPMLLISILISVSLVKWLKEDFGDTLAPHTYCLADKKVLDMKVVKNKD